METTTKVKIIEVGPIQQHITTTKTTRVCTLKVKEVPKGNNVFGYSIESQIENKNIFSIEVYNHNIEKFGINGAITNRLAEVDLIFEMYKEGWKVFCSGLNLV